MTLGDLVKNYRTAHGLSQRQFALQCGLSNGYISLLEKEVNPNTEKPITPTIPNLCKLADGMGITIDELLKRVDDMPIDLSEPIPIFSVSRYSDAPTPELAPDESDLLHKYRRLDDAAKGRIRHMVDYEYNSIPGSTANPAPKEA